MSESKQIKEVRGPTGTSVAAPSKDKKERKKHSHGLVPLPIKPDKYGDGKIVMESINSITAVLNLTRFIKRLFHKLRRTAPTVHK